MTKLSEACRADILKDVGESILGGEALRHQVVTSLRKCGNNPTNIDVDKACEGVDMADAKQILEIVENNIKDVKREELANEEALRNLTDNKSNLISKNLFIDCVTKHGDDPITIQQAKELMDLAGTVDGDFVAVQDLMKILSPTNGSIDTMQESSQKDNAGMQDQEKTSNNGQDSQAGTEQNPQQKGMEEIPQQGTEQSAQEATEENQSAEKSETIDRQRKSPEQSQETDKPSE